MKKIIIEPDKFSKIILVSGDGDFKILIDFLIEQNRFKKIIFPSKKYVSSLYKSINISFKDYLINLEEKIKYKKRGVS